MGVINIEKLKQQKSDELKKHDDAVEYATQAMRELVSAAIEIGTPRWDPLGGNLGEKKQDPGPYISIIMVPGKEEWLSRQTGLIATEQGLFCLKFEDHTAESIAQIIANTCNNDCKVIELVINEALLGRPYYANDIPQSVD